MSIDSVKSGDSPRTDRFTGLWVAVEAGVGRDSRTHQLAEALGISIPAAVGHLVLLWGGLAEHEPGGVSGPLPNKTLEVWASWSGKRGRFAVSFRNLFEGPDGKVHAWERHNGRFLAEALRERQRKATERARKRLGLSPDCPGTVTGSSTVNPTQPNPTNSGAGKGAPLDIPAIAQITEALNDGMRANHAIEHFKPVKVAPIAGEWLNAGIPLDLICETVGRLGREFKPTAKDLQISSLKYCDAAVREAPAGLDEARYRFLTGEARRGVDMAQHADWPQHRDRYLGRGAVSNGTV